MISIRMFAFFLFFSVALSWRWRFVSLPFIISCEHCTVCIHLPFPSWNERKNFLKIFVFLQKHCKYSAPSSYGKRPFSINKCGVDMTCSGFRPPNPIDHFVFDDRGKKFGNIEKAKQGKCKYFEKNLQDSIYRCLLTIFRTFSFDRQSFPFAQIFPNSRQKIYWWWCTAGRSSQLTTSQFLLWEKTAVDRRLRGDATDQRYTGNPEILNKSHLYAQNRIHTFMLMHILSGKKFQFFIRFS